MKIYVGHDSREDIAYQVCEHSIKRRDPSAEVIPLKQKQMRDQGLYTRPVDKLASTEFTFTRFLIPHLMNYKGWALFCDSDIVFLEDVDNLFALADDSKAVMVVQHDYKPKPGMKMDGQVQTVYPRKNWSSVILWNCEHEDNKCLTPEFVSRKSGAFLHRFKWLKDDQIGEIDKTWNWLAIEYNDNPKAKLIHYTLGTPCFDKFYDTSMSSHWKRFFKKMLTGIETKIKL